MIRVNQAIYDLAQTRIADGIWSVDPDAGLVLHPNGTPVKASLNTWGYLRLRIGSNVSVLAHRVIWESQHGPIPPNYFVNHIDGVKTNNAISNLEVVTQQANLKHARDTGLISNIYKYSDDVVRDVRQRRERGESAKSIAAAVGMSASHVYSITSNRKRRSRVL